MSGPNPAHYPTVGPRIPALSAAIASVPTVSIKDRFARNVPAIALRGFGSPPVANLLWTDGYQRWHTRYGRKGAFAIFHVSSGVVTAAQEVFGGAGTTTPADDVPAESRLELVVDIDVHRIVDLTDSSVQTALGVTHADLTGTDLLATDAFGRPDAYEITQCIGELVYACEFGGIKYPAARYTPGFNIAIFTDYLTITGGTIIASNPLTGANDRLP